MKTCPFCNNQLMDAVVRCVHCGKDLNTPEAEAAASGAPSPVGASPAAAPGSVLPPSVTSAPEPEADFSNEPEYFAMKTQMTPEGERPAPTATFGKGVGGQDARSLMRPGGILALAGAALAAAGLFALPLLSVTYGGVLVDLPKKLGSSITLEAGSSTAGFAEWSGILKILLVVGIASTLVAAILALAKGGQGVGKLLAAATALLLVAAGLFFFVGLGVLRDGVSVDVGQGAVAGLRQFPADVQVAIQDQLDAAVQASTAVGSYLVLAGAVLAFSGGLMAILRLRRAAEVRSGPSPAPTAPAAR